MSMSTLRKFFEYFIVEDNNYLTVIWALHNPFTCGQSIILDYRFNKTDQITPKTITYKINEKVKN